MLRYFFYTGQPLGDACRKKAKPFYKLYYYYGFLNSDEF